MQHTIYCYVRIYIAKKTNNYNIYNYYKKIYKIRSDYILFKTTFLDKIAEYINSY
jgi:hypothetical protein